MVFLDGGLDNFLFLDNGARRAHSTTSSSAAPSV
jgi:hypothetical protein